MKSIIPFLIICLLITGCSHRIVRTGYQMQTAGSAPCDVVIKKNFLVPDAMATKVGEIKLGETGFAVACSEGHAMEILKGEACALKADLINIIEEKRSDLWSSCYRARAEFYKYNVQEGSGNIVSDESYKPDKVEERVSQDRQRSTLLKIGFAGVGFLLGFLLTG